MATEILNSKTMQTYNGSSISFVGECVDSRSKNARSLRSMKKIPRKGQICKVVGKRGKRGDYRYIIHMIERNAEKTIETRWSFKVFNKDQHYIVGKRLWGTSGKELRTVYSNTPVPRKCPTLVYNQKMFLPAPYLVRILHNRGLPLEIVMYVLMEFVDLDLFTNQCMICKGGELHHYFLCMMCRQKFCCLPRNSRIINYKVLDCSQH
jgi:hypothetical protein